MFIKVGNILFIIFIISLFGCEKKDNSIIPIVPPDSIPTDFRTKYVGNYNFTLKLMSLQIYPDTAYWSTELFQHFGSIELYNKDRLLIKYTSFLPLGRCVTGTSWCQGGLKDPCVTNCGGQQLFFVRNWLSPLIFPNDSLLLFKEYSRLNGSGKFNNDTISFVTKLYENWSVYEEHIIGIKEKN